MDKNNNPSDSDTNLAVLDYMQIMDVADASRRMQKAVETQLSLDEQKSEIRKHLKETYAAMGENVSDTQLDNAIEKFFSQNYEFKEPNKTLEYRLAELYVARGKIARDVGVPLVAAGVIIGGGYAAVTTVNAARERHREAAVETGAETAYHTRTSLYERLAALTSSPIREELPQTEHHELTTLISTSTGRLQKLDDEFFKQYCIDGQTRDTITRDNYNVLAPTLTYVEQEIAGITRDVQTGEGIIDYQKQLTGMTPALEAIVGDIRNSHPPKPWLKETEKRYAAGKIHIANRDLKAVTDDIRQLQELLSKINEYGIIVTELDQRYAAVRALAKEQGAVRTAEQFYQDARDSLDAINFDNAQKQLKGMVLLEEVLGQDYTLTITGGKWRFLNDNNSIRNYYVLVKAVSPEGHVYQKSIRNEETGDIETVNEWGEHVPEEVYEMVKADKMDNGIINNSTFGKKKKGYVTEEVTMTYHGRPLQRTGQITRW
ncbi:hypothetical protein HY639_03685 [Candidatus Woesearchaeota archaeon]|nr:hypothetical protein [Candidatus Woesearchaeota archaeon]